MDLQRPEKIILAMNSLSGGTSKPLRYEDIVVKAFEMFPDDFALRGYPKYPDSSDIHKPLYGPLKRAGHVLAGNKQFRLTQKGLERARQLTSSGRKIEKTVGERLSRDKEAEIQRIFQTEAFRLFFANEGDNILDTDFYAYLGVTVRTPRNDFLGRLKTVEEAVKAASISSKDPVARKIVELHTFVVGRFSNLVEQVRKGK
jgi:hypothetical protein